MPITTGPLVVARRLTTGLVVAAAIGTGVVGVQLASARAAADAENGVATASDAGATTGSDDGALGQDGDGGSSTGGGFQAVRPVQPGVAVPHARTSGS